MGRGYDFRELRAYLANVGQDEATAGSSPENRVSAEHPDRFRMYRRRFPYRRQVLYLSALLRIRDREQRRRSGSGGEAFGLRTVRRPPGLDQGVPSLEIDSGS